MMFRNITLFQFRRMFIATAPWETYYEKVEDVPDFIEESIPFFMLLIVLEFTISQIKGLGTHRVGDAISSLGAGIISQLMGLVIMDVTLQFYIWVYDNFHIVDLPWNSPWTWILAFVVVDFAYYWFHRVTHDVNFLWTGHQPHHSAEDYNLTTALRQGVLQKYSSFLFYAPAALAIPPSIFLVHSHFNLLYQFWVHTEEYASDPPLTCIIVLALCYSGALIFVSLIFSRQLIGTLGPLEYILSTPSSHRVHHGINPVYYHANFGGTLIIWDRLFGTYVRESVVPRYGLHEPLGTFSPVWCQLNHPWNILMTLKSTEGWKNRVLMLVNGPGWYPGRARVKPLSDVKNIDLSKPKFGSPLPSMVNVYIIIHFASMMLLYQELVSNLVNISHLPLIGCILFLILTLQCFGYMCDHRVFAGYVELLRCAVFLGVYMTHTLLNHTAVHQLALAVHVSMITHAVSLILWVIVCTRDVVKIRVE